MQLCAFDLLMLDGDDLRDVPLSMRQANLAGPLGPMDREETQKVWRLVEIIDACGASGTEPETVFGWIEEDLRARLATTVRTGEL
jgi:ATP-dependent DNA ligase